jgi:hypothetical protein
LSRSNAHCIVAKNDTLHLVWFDDRPGNHEVFYMRSTDAGLSWSQDTILSGQGNLSTNPSITTSGSNVHLVYQDMRDGNWEIYYKGSTDGGTSWTIDKRLTNNPASSNIPSVAANEQFVHAVYQDPRDGNGGPEIYYRRSTDGGNFWDTNLRLTNAAGYSEYPSICTSGSTMHVAWQDERDGNEEIYYKRSSDNGSNWGTDTRLTVDNDYSRNPSISAVGSIVHVAWSDGRDSDELEIYYKQSTDGGLSWGSDLRITYSPRSSYDPSIVTSDSVINIFYLVSPGGSTPSLYNTRSLDNGQTWEENTRVTYDSSGKQYFSAAAFGSALYLVWMDYRDSNDFEIYFKRNPTGEPTDVRASNNNIPNDYYLFQNYPNPFNPVTNIGYRISNSEFVSLKIYDVLGREVATLINEEKAAGNYEVIFNAKNYPSGIYFYKINSGNFTDTKKMLLIK